MNRAASKSRSALESPGSTSGKNWRWMWHRLRAMSWSERSRHLLKKYRAWQDERRPPPSVDFAVPTAASFPRLPERESAPEEFREALRTDAHEIMAGCWTAFGRQMWAVDVPPEWHKDYLAGTALPESRSAFQLNHRKLPGGADIKCIWELSRWTNLVRLAQAAWLLREDAPAKACLHCLQDWTVSNVPYRGWNWTSALEAGMRLIQWTWIDAFLARLEDPEIVLQRTALSRDLLSPHAWFTWRHGTFGSSANNHLLGELAGLIAAQARWPELERCSTSIRHLQELWETEVLKQFAKDGGNREQALNYHLFSWEFSWIARNALRHIGKTISNSVEERLRAASDYFATVQMPHEPWDYGDSDNAFVVPWMLDMKNATAEWYHWFESDQPAASPALRFWWGAPTEPVSSPKCRATPSDWLYYPDTGQATRWAAEWDLRWDLSPLGYLSTAAHGHLDALHLSIWYRDFALVIDPGTGAYYADPQLRDHLASWAAHNGPQVAGPDWPRRMGTFLWSEHPPRPALNDLHEGHLQADYETPWGRLIRSVKRLHEEDGWQVDDSFEPRPESPYDHFFVHWQFAPGWILEPVHERRFLLKRQDRCVELGLDAHWKEVRVYDPSPEDDPRRRLSDGEYQGLCSPGFRELALGPSLWLAARGHIPCLFRTTFLASPLE